MPFLPLLGSIVFINMMLSGDNALAISALLAMISPDRRWLVLAFGGSGAIVLRIICTLCVASWLNASFVQAPGGLLLLFMAIQQLSNQQQHASQPQQEVAVPSMTKIQDGVKQPGGARYLMQLSQQLIGSKLSFAPKGLLGGIAAMVVADSTTSVDNIIAIGAIGAMPGANCLLLAFGLTLSMTGVLLVSTRLAWLIQRLPWLTFIASLLLAIRAGGLITAAASSVFRMISIYPGQDLSQWFIDALCCFIVLLLAGSPEELRRKVKRRIF